MSSGVTWLEAHAGDLVSRVRRDGGFTVDPRTGEIPTAGFAVNAGAAALVVPAARFFGSGGTELVIGYLRDHPWLTEDTSTVLLGAWHDPRSDLVVLSGVDRVPDEDRAVALGVTRGQTDVYDLAEERLVPTGVVRPERN